jgi:hypothetical protein
VLDYGPSTTAKLGGEQLGWHPANRLLLSGQSRSDSSGSGRGARVIVLRVLQPLDERRRLLASELAGGLALCEPHWATCVAEIGVARLMKKG